MFLAGKAVRSDKSTSGALDRLGRSLSNLCLVLDQLKEAFRWGGGDVTVDR